MKLKSQTWSRVLFKINSFTGKINKTFYPKQLNNKVSKEEIENVLNNLENHTENFYFLKTFTKLKYFLIFAIFILILIGILLFTVFLYYNEGGIVMALASLLTLMFLYLLTSFYKKIVIKIRKITDVLLSQANENIFLKRRLYIMISDRLDYIAIYIIPLSVNLGVILHNFTMNSTVININNEASEETPNIIQILKNKNKIDELFGKKYTNFNKNNFFADKL